MVSLALAILGIVLPRFFAAALTGPSADSLLLRLAVFGILTLGFAVGTGLLGLAGIVIVERNRGRTEGPAGRMWDGARLAGLASVVAGGLFFLPGLIVSFVYLPDYARPAFAMQTAGWLALSVSIGVYLYLTARRMDLMTRWLGGTALALGFAAAGLTATLSVTVEAGLFLEDLTLAMILNLSIAMFGLLSLVIWIVVYSRILDRFPSANRPTIAVCQA